MKIIGPRRLLRFLSFTVLCFFTSHLIAQTGTPITGKILAGKTRTPLQGATVQIAGSTNTVITGNKGEFRITTYKPLPISILITYTGYSSKELQITDANAVEVILEEAAAEVSDVVVVGYGTQRRSELTGS